MTDDEWEQHRQRAILAAFQTGRPVLADSDGELSYADGDRTRLADDVGVPKTALPKATTRRSWWARVKRWMGGSTRR